MKKLIMMFVVLFPFSSQAEKVMCVDSIHGKLCGTVVYFQDSSMKHFSYGVKDFTLNNRSFVLSKDFSSKFICSAFRPDGINTRPQLPFGLSKITKKVVVRWTTYSNGDCRPTYDDALVEVDCYSDQ
jgi:hypothetical protein